MGDSASQKPPVVIWISYVRSDSKELVKKIRQSLSQVDPGIDLQTFEIVIDGSDEYILAPGETVDSLTDRIARSKGVVFLLSKGFPKSKYSCRELGWVLRRRTNRSYFLHLNAECSKQKTYVDRLARAVVTFNGSDSNTPSFPENYVPLPAVSVIKKMLEERKDEIISSRDSDPEKIALSISAYADKFVRSAKAEELSQSFNHWLQFGGGVDLYSYMKEHLSGGVTVADLVSSIFMNHSLDHVPSFERVLIGYRNSLKSVVLNSQGQQNLQVAAGYFALTLFDKSYIDSIKSIGDLHTLLEIDIPQDYIDGGGVISAIAVAIAENNVPKLVIDNFQRPNLAGAGVADAIRISEISSVSDIPEENEKAYLRQFIQQLWRIVMGGDPALVDSEPAFLSQRHRDDLIGEIKHARVMGRSMNLHFTVDTDTYTSVPNWPALVRRTIDELNKSKPVSGNDHSADKEYIPSIIIRGKKTGKLPWAPGDYRLRTTHFFKILKLAQPDE